MSNDHVALESSAWTIESSQMFFVQCEKVSIKQGTVWRVGRNDSAMANYDIHHEASHVKAHCSRNPEVSVCIIKLAKHVTCSV